jgi:osmotically-inducible protein OsmY
MSGQRETRSAIQQVLHADPRLRGSAIRVSVTKGVATLTGTVASANLKPVAQALALRVDGVRDVVNNLGVAGEASGVSIAVPRRITGGDAALAQAVRDALAGDDELRGLPIMTTVIRRRVTLTGIVESRDQSLTAERCVRGVTGVDEVVNQLVPRTLHDLIAEARASAGDAGDGRIQLTIGDRTVAVDGTARSWDEKQAVLEAIADSGATYGIIDRLRVEPAR